MQQESVPSIEARFDEIIESYGALMRRAIHRVCPKDLGLQFDDIEQDARLKLWNALQSERKIENISSYIYKIAATTTIDAIRRVQARKENQLADRESGDDEVENHVTKAIGQSPEDLALQQELLRKIEHALKQMPENRRRAVNLHLRGMTNLEVSEILGWSKPKTRNLIYRGLEDLRKHLRAAGINYEG